MMRRHPWRTSLLLHSIQSGIPSRSFASCHPLEHPPGSRDGVGGRTVAPATMLQVGNVCECCSTAKRSRYQVLKP